MTSFRCGLSAVAVMATLAATPALAGSVETDAYIASVSQDLDILSGSSALAGHRAVSDAIKSFARGEISAPVLRPEAAGTGDAPAVVAANMPGPYAVDSNGVETARSAHTDEIVDPTVYRPPLGTGVQMPTAAVTMSYLEGTNGKAFDWAYKAAQETALTALRAVETAYAQTGDDADLRAGAIAQLPTIDARLAALRSL